MSVTHPLAVGQKVIVEGRATVCVGCGVKPKAEEVESVIKSVSVTPSGCFYRIDTSFYIVREDQIISLIEDTPAPVKEAPKPAPVKKASKPAPTPVKEEAPVEEKQYIFDPEVDSKEDK